jgi:hypothetical protein
VHIPFGPALATELPRELPLTSGTGIPSDTFAVATLPGVLQINQLMRLTSAVREQDSNLHLPVTQGSTVELSRRPDR